MIKYVPRVPTQINLILVALFLVLLPFQNRAQISFDEAIFMIDDQETHSGVAMGFADLNGDGLDDLVVLDDIRNLYVVIQTTGFANRYDKFIQTTPTGGSWSLQVADVNNDGLQDIYSAGPGGQVVFAAMNQNFDFNQQVVAAYNFLSQGSNFVDINSDGFVDLFVCDDNAENFIAINNGLGVFIETPGLMDFSTTPASDGSGNYGSVWSDYNRDGFIDMYLSKCRLGSAPGAPERSNQFFTGGPTGLERNFDFPNILSNAQSWVADFIDVDNDGDWDLFLANHDEPMNLFIQQADGSFVDEAPQRGLNFEGGVIQSVSGDYDNDGDVDIMIAGNIHFIMKNDGAGNFTDAEVDLGEHVIESATCGDYNNDGRLDIFAGYAHIYNNPSNIADRLFLNTSAADNYINFSLRGGVSNKSAIGATVEIVHGNRRQLREIRSGESYGINKTNIAHFGLGADVHVDSVIVFWPSGHQATYFNLIAGQTIQITEDVGPVDEFVIGIEPSQPAFCQDDTMQLSISEGSQWIWNTGDTTQEISISVPRVYSVNVWVNDQWKMAPAFQVIADDQNSIVVETTGDLIKCKNEILTLESNAGLPLMWNTGDTSNEIQVTGQGEYFYSQQGFCGIKYSDTVVVENNLVADPIVENDTVDQYATAELLSNDLGARWAVDTSTPNVIFTGPIFSIDSLESDSTVFVAREHRFVQDPSSVGVPSPDTSSDGYHSLQLSAGMNFSVHANCVLNQVTVYCREAGPRTILIINSTSSQEVHRFEIVMHVGFNTLQLDADLAQGEEYSIATDSDANFANFGFVSPDFIRSNQDVNYPMLGNELNILGTSFGNSKYYYFYNWVVTRQDRICFSDWIPVHAVVDKNVAAVDIQSLSDGIRIFPNPTINEVIINLENPNEWRAVNMLSSTGIKIDHQEITRSPKLEFVDFPSGIYFLQFIHESGATVVKKLVIL